MFLKAKRLLLAIVILALSASANVAQEETRTQSLRFGISDQPGNCETNSNHLYILRELTREEPNQKSVISLVARLGTGETNRTWNKRRLYNIKRALEENIGISPQKIVAAEGERIVGFGRVEYYWNGEFIGASIVPKNADICVRCCGYEPEYYPEKDLKKPKQKIRRRG